MDKSDYFEQKSIELESKLRSILEKKKHIYNY